MKIKYVNYLENKKMAVKQLDEYYAEKCGFELTEQETNHDDYDNTVSIALEDNDSIIGRIFGTLDKMTASIRIEGLVVDKSTRGTGIGRILVDEFEKYGIKENCQICFVDTTSSSAPKFYEKQGYSLIGVINDYPMPSEIYYLYMKRLNK